MAEITRCVLNSEWIRQHTTFLFTSRVKRLLLIRSTSYLQQSAAFNSISIGDTVILGIQNWDLNNGRYDTNDETIIFKAVIVSDDISMTYRRKPDAIYGMFTRELYQNYCIYIFVMLTHPSFILCICVFVRVNKLRI